MFLVLAATMIFTTLTALGVGRDKMGSFGRVCERVIHAWGRVGLIVRVIWVANEEVVRLLVDIKRDDQMVCPPPPYSESVSVVFLATTPHDQADTRSRILTTAAGCPRVVQLLCGVGASPTFVNRRMGSCYRLPGFVV